MKPLRIALTMGDPAGIGPELCIQLLRNRVWQAECVPVVFGSERLLRRVAGHLGWQVDATWLSAERWRECEAWRDLDQPAVVDVDRGGVDLTSIEPGQIGAQAGEAAYQSIIAAIDAALAGEVAAVVTAPIHKESLKLAGVPHPGHTEILAERTGTSRYCMMLTSPEITCSLVTTHVGLRDVPFLLNTERILEVITLSDEAMSAIGNRNGNRRPRLVVCGLNPHAGEHGLFGQGEEEETILPAIEAARGQGIYVEGPLPPDTAFVPSRRASTDCYVCMYHDQGLIPLKALAFDRAVNLTLGLPIVRTSVDHGTAFDIAWRGQADPSSFVEAVKLAIRLAAGRAT